MDFRVGGSERVRFRSKDGLALKNDTTYQDILPSRHIVLAYAMSVGDKRISSSQATVEFLSTGKGTDLIFTEQAAFFEGADGPQIRGQGGASYSNNWRGSWRASSQLNRKGTAHA